MARNQEVLELIDYGIKEWSEDLNLNPKTGWLLS
jgi:hypothetical protein